MCVLAYASDAIDPNLHHVRVRGIDKAKFRHPITPATRCDRRSRPMQNADSNIWKCAGTAMVGEVAPAVLAA